MKTILVADDDPAILDALRMMLEFEGYAVMTTADGKTVYDIHRHNPDLVLLDIWMSGQDGRDICKSLKSRELTKHVPVILISASRDIARSAVESGADDFIAKPFEQDDLLAMVRKYIGPGEQSEA